MATTAQRPVGATHQRSSLGRAIWAGMFAGLGGGLLFGILMWATGMLPVVAEVIGANNTVAAFFAHMFISAFIGATYGIVARRLPMQKRTHLVAGVLTGLFWWVVGGLVMIPIGLGRIDLIMEVGGAQLVSLAGHILYGIVTALLFVPLIKQL